MKGKGKGEREKEREREREREREKSGECKECPLQFPDMTPVDHARLCPRYTAVLARSSDNGIGMDEVDTLQTELETLLASVAKRMMLLEAEMRTLSNWQDNKVITLPPVPTPGKTKGKGPEGKRGGKGGDEKPSKRFKDAQGKGTYAPSPGGRPKGKAQTLKQEFEYPESPKTQQPDIRVIKNDAPNRFWALVEPYCQEITQEDLKVLEDIVRSHEEDAEYHKVPSLGKHYSQKWAAEDMMDEQREGGRVTEIKRRSSSVNLNNTNENSISKKNTNDDIRHSELAFNLDLVDDESPFGPLTQRLVSALIEENIMTPLEDASIEADAAEAATMSPRSLAKQLNVGNTAQLERRIRRVLEENDILDLDERSIDENPEDEILTELRRKQQELRVMSQQNLQHTKRLHKLAKDEVARQDLRRKMAAADADVMDAYRKIQATKQKKRTPTKKEREQALKALKERETIIKSLEAIS